MKWRFTFGSAVTHEAFRFCIGLRSAIRIGTTRQENLDNEVVCRTIGFAQSRVEWRLAGDGPCVIHVCTVFDQELTELPVPMKRRAIEAEIETERRQ